MIFTAHLIRLSALLSLLLSFVINLSICGAEETKLEDLMSKLSQDVIPADQALNDVRRFSASRITPIPEINSLEDWKLYADRIREAALRDVVFKGRAAEWRQFVGGTEMLDTIEGGAGYSIRKLRIEVLPDLWIPGLLYVPNSVSGKVPVFLNVNGHDRNGKAAEYKQARCIHMARNGIIALNLEWFGMGQLATGGYSHGRMNQLDLCGASGLAPFYLALSRGLDVLLSLENADPQRVGVAGLSGGGWQTILISSLDTRVTLCNPVAGYSGFRTRIDQFTDLGDSEQTPVDLGITADYQQLTTLLAPRAALLTYNEKDNCCFASAHALPPLMEAATPVYQLYGQESRLRSHVNSDPGDHNFLIDNRQALYRMIRDQWFEGSESKFPATELPLETELRNAEALQVPLPVPNQDFQTVAWSLMKSIEHRVPDFESAETESTWYAGWQKRLSDVVHLRRPKVTETTRSVGTVGDTSVIHWKLNLGSDWAVPVTEFNQGKGGPVALVISDQGRSETAALIAPLLKDGYHVFVADLLFTGELRIPEREYLWALMISTAGERPLGVQTGQLLSIADWLRYSSDNKAIRLVTEGTRCSVIGLTAAALDRSMFEKTDEHQPLNSLKELIEKNFSVEQAPELFCFGLLEVTDLPQMRQVVQRRK
jgi:hypothetical protein